MKTILKDPDEIVKFENSLSYYYNDMLQVNKINSNEGLKNFNK